MASAKHSLYFQAILLCSTIFLNPIRSIHGESNLHKPHHHDDKKLLFVFGDSLFDPGNNQYLPGDQNDAATAWPYGMSNHNHSTGRLSDGLLVPDFIAQFGGLKVLPPYMQPNANFSDGVNFASAGSGVLENSNSPLNVMNLRTQLDDFTKVVALMAGKVGKTNAKKALTRSVFLISMGGNDYFSFKSNYPNATETQRRNYVHMVVGNLTNGFTELYDMGLRKLAVQNVGPLGCYPMMRATYPQANGGCVLSLLEHAKLHNKALSAALKMLQRRLPGFKYSVFDYYHSIADRMKNPTKYGFKVGDIGCCGSGPYNGRNCGIGSYNLCKNPNEYVIFDGGHHTQRTNLQLAELLWGGAPDTTAPYNVNDLFHFA